MKKQFLVFVFGIISTLILAQKPYFQQDVAFTIQVKLDDKKHELNAFETLIYKNNSPDALPFIYMHLWPNAYTDIHSRLGQQFEEDQELFFHFAADSLRGSIDSLDFKVDGQPVKLEYDAKNPDIAKLILNVALQPGGQISITTPFRVHIPIGKISRLGHIGQQYQITQWFPKPAVYDRNGWNQMPYLNQGEFYSEFGTFDVYISLPQNYVLGSTGDLIDNPQEVHFLDSIAEATKNIGAYDKKDVKFPASSPIFKTVHYHQEHVHDFAWFCDKRYHVLKGEVELPHTKRKVSTCVMYTNMYASYWKDAIKYVNDALYYYSLWNGDYTYDVCTAVDGALSAGGGMEYPNITVIGAVGSARTLDLVITHEVGHNWFYGMLGSNERIHTWMDEGINSANEMRYMMLKYPNAKLISTPINGLLDMDRYYQKAQYYQAYAFCARMHTDQPDDIPAVDYTGINYGTVVYMKSAVIFNYLRAYLSDSVYDKCFQTYFDRWHWKHPMPEDIKAVFVEVSGKNLDWVFEDLIRTNKHMDYKMAGIDQSANGFALNIKNKGEVNGPFSISGMKEGKTIKTQWYDGFAGENTVNFPAGDYDELYLDQGEWMPEVNRKNNTIKTSGVLKKTEPLRLQPIGSLDNPQRTQLFFTPAFGYNKYDKFMLGAALYNHVVPGKTFEWTLLPMYSFGDKSVVGHADAFFNLWPNKVFQHIRLGINANKYHFYQIQREDHPLDAAPDRRLGFIKIAPEINFAFKKKRERSPINQSVKFRAVWLATNAIYSGYDSASSNLIWEVQKQERTFYELRYNFSYGKGVHNFNGELKGQMGDNMSKLQLTAKYELNYMRKRTIEFRLFAGSFLDASNAGPYRFRMSSWGPQGIGNHDYLFDNVYIGRSEEIKLWSNQTYVEDGGFRVYSPVGQSDKWLTSLNVTSQLPFKNRLLGMIKVYGNAGLFNTTGISNPLFVYESGLQFSLIANGLLDVYIPLLYSQSIQDYHSANDIQFHERIRFTLNITLLNPSTILQGIQL
jgi:Peptidase family M1 domain